MKGRPVRGLIGGLLLGIFVDIDLALSGVVKLESVVLTIVPIALLVVGLLLGLWAPIGRSETVRAIPASGPAPPTVTTVRTSTPPEPQPPAPDPPPPTPAAPPTEDTPPI
jgi:hypothetical protein